jgi:HipA-like C-terminal domain
MIDSNIPLVDRLTALLLNSGALAAREICQKLGISQPTLSRAIADLGDSICRMGAARSTRYALSKDILGWPARQPIVFTEAHGNLQAWGELTYLRPNGTFAKTKGGEWFSAAGRLPWFLMPLRPQGFLGRQYARARADFPPNPDDWSLAQTLLIITQHAHNAPGAFGLGQTGFAGRLVDAVSAAVADRLTQYDAAAVNASQTLPLGSSAGGEQPKFLSEYSDAQSYQHCIVKFTPPHGTPFGTRWRALLALEQLALQTLAAHGVSAADTHLLHSTRRSYLESVRFDRIGMEGKQHVVAIAALHDEFVGGSWTNWVKTSEALAKKGLITTQELGQIASIFAFGHYIGNSDMHSGNLSFFVDDVITPKIRLAPVYDMLPMMWKPDIHQGALSDSPVRQQPLPTGFPIEQEQARQWAIEFWEQAAQLDIGTPLQEASLESAQRLKSNFSDI